MRSPLRRHDPRRLGRYQLTERLGEGGQGVVFLGIAQNGQAVAIKLLHAQLIDNQSARERFVREVETAARVHPSFTAGLLEADVTGDQPYVVSEYIDGPSLQRLVAEHGPLSDAELAKVVNGTATALAAIHRAGVIHRDLKPGNILMSSTGPRVIDFGIARALDITPSMTSSVIGSPAYMAPEQFETGDDGRPSGQPADVFAWAATMTYAASGRAPFGTDDIPRIMKRILNDEPDLSAVPDALRELLAQCMLKQPELRPTAPEIRQRLGHQQTGLPPAVGGPAALASGDPDDRSRRRRRVLIASAIGGAVLALAAVTTFAIGALWPDDRPEDAGQSPSRVPGESPAPNDPESAANTAGATPDPEVTDGTDPAGEATPFTPPRRGSELPGSDGGTVVADLDGPLTLVGYAGYSGLHDGWIHQVWDSATERFAVDERASALVAEGFSPDGAWMTYTEDSAGAGGTAGPGSTGGAGDADRVLLFHRAGELDDIAIAPGDFTIELAERELEPDEEVRLAAPRWSPDGERLLMGVYTRTPLEDGDGFAFATLGYGVTAPFDDDAGPLFVERSDIDYLDWHPGGSDIVLNPAGDADGRSDIEVVAVGESEGEVLLPDAGSLGVPALGSFSPDGSRVATHCDVRSDASEDVDVACVFDLETGREIATFEIGKPDTATFGLLEWYGDDHLLINGPPASDDGSVVVVDLEGEVTDRLLADVADIFPHFARSPGRN